MHITFTEISLASIQYSYIPCRPVANGASARDGQSRAAGNAGKGIGRAMAARDYRKLCPNSGHVLPQGTNDALRPGRPQAAPCEVCGRVVDIQPDPATGRMLLYSMHDRESAADGNAGKVPR
jgi:hypothetical protein